MNWQNEMSSEGLLVHILSDDMPPSPQMELLERGHYHEHKSRTIHIGSIYVTGLWHPLVKPTFANKGQVLALSLDLF